MFLQHLLTNGEQGFRRPRLPSHTSVIQWACLLDNMCMLWSNVLLYSRGPRCSSCTDSLWYDSSKKNGTSCVYWFCLLGSYCILWAHSNSRISTNRCTSHQNSPGVLLPPKLMCKSLPVCTPDSAVSSRLLHPSESLWNMFTESCKVINYTIISLKIFSI